MPIALGRIRIRTDARILSVVAFADESYGVDWYVQRRRSHLINAVLAPLSFFLSQRSLLILAGVFISNACFIFAARELHRKRVFGSVTLIAQTHVVHHGRPASGHRVSDAVFVESGQHIYVCYVRSSVTARCSLRLPVTLKVSTHCAPCARCASYILRIPTLTHVYSRVLMSQDRVLASSVWIAAAALARSNGNLLVFYLLPDALRALWALMRGTRGAFLVRLMDLQLYLPDAHRLAFGMRVQG